jgi:hypothetical protein
MRRIFFSSRGRRPGAAVGPSTGGDRRPATSAGGAGLAGCLLLLRADAVEAVAGRQRRRRFPCSQPGCRVPGCQRPPGPDPQGPSNPSGPTAWHLRRRAGGRPGRATPPCSRACAARPPRAPVRRRAACRLNRHGAPPAQPGGTSRPTMRCGGPCWCGNALATKWTFRTARRLLERFGLVLGCSGHDQSRGPTAARSAGWPARSSASTHSTNRPGSRSGPYLREERRLVPASTSVVKNSRASSGCSRIGL